MASILQQRFPGQDFANVKNEIEMMEMLSSCCTTAHQYCKQVIVKCRVAQVISFSRRLLYFANFLLSLSGAEPYVQSSER